jgi:hypothetical protein
LDFIQSLTGSHQCLEFTPPVMDAKPARIPPVEASNGTRTGSDISTSGSEMSIPVFVVSDEEVRSPKMPRSSSNSSLGTTTRKRLSTLGAASTINIQEDKELGLIRMRSHPQSVSPITSPKYGMTKQPDSTLPSPPANPVLVISPAEVQARLAYVPLGSRRRAQVKSGRLVSFGTIIIALAALLWFSVYERHSYLGLDDDEAATAKRGPFFIVAVSLMFLGLAALCAGVSIQREEEEHRVRVVRGDSVLGMIAQHETSGTEHVEPTTPQRMWAMKAVAELERL